MWILSYYSGLPAKHETGRNSLETFFSGFSFLIIVNILAGSIASTAVYLLRLFGEVGSENLTLASDIVR